MADPGEGISTEKLVADVKILIRDVEAMIKASASQAGELRERLAHAIADGRASLAHYERDVRAKAEQAKALTGELLRDEDWRRVFVAVGLGVVVGLILRRRRRRSGQMARRGGGAPEP